MRHADNVRIAERLAEAAELLERQGANPFRVRAYRRASETIGTLDADVHVLATERGGTALEELPTVGAGIAAAVREMLATGRWAMLDRLRGDVDPEALFATVPGVGPELARRLHDELHVESLEALEAAAWDGRAAALEGIGPRRLAALREGLATRLGRLARRAAPPTGPVPPVALLLDEDRRYRAAAAREALPKIAPRRFNPSGEAWLPVMHATRRGWHFTVLHSNTALAHRLGRTRDWVVIYCYDDGHRERQFTVVTETAGPLAGLRVVRGREPECAAHYASRRRASLHDVPIDAGGARGTLGAES